MKWTESQQPSVFQEDEMNLIRVDEDWTAADLLEKEGIFFLKDVAPVLGMEPILVKRHVRLIEQKGQSPWQVMGARKIWNHWIVRMKVFAPYYRVHLTKRTRKVNPDWDGNTLLQQRGIFYLTDVCGQIPFATHQLRYQASRRRNPRGEIGVWKDADLNAFLVDMDVFGSWIKRLWTNPGIRRVAG